jgi:glycosidase
MKTRLRLYEINTRAFCRRFDQIPSAWLSRIAALGFNAVWVMGAWRIGQGAKAISRVISNEFDGSPFAIADYEYSPELGGREAYLDFVGRARGAGLRVLLDFIPNHMALDCPWIAEDLTLFIRSNPDLRKQDPGDYYLHPTGEAVAHGKDPYFPPWCDTAQLDYTSEKLRLRQIANLKRIGQDADGVRCDMAMLLLRHYFLDRWYPKAPVGWLSQRMPGEFWESAITEVKSALPEFIFLAEAYWGKEPDLQRLGFDLTYDKLLYDALVARNASWVRELVSRPVDLMRRSMFFIENHDEPRAASVFDPDENLAAIAMLLALPGSVLLHHGQIEGFRQKVAIQLGQRTPPEETDTRLKSGYEAILNATNNLIFENGELDLLPSRSPDVVSFVRRNSDRIVGYAGYIGGKQSEFNQCEIDVSAAAGKGDTLIVRDLLGRGSISIERIAGRFTFTPEELVRDDVRFCLFEICTPPTTR